MSHSCKTVPYCGTLQPARFSHREVLVSHEHIRNYLVDLPNWG